jgi:sterol desaturase/sphingolipid hydroxylase (fatty acid hydroxylase superfamily)
MALTREVIMIKHLRTAIRNDLEAPAEAREFGSGWISGVMALILGIAVFLLQLSQEFPQWFSMKDLGVLHAAPEFSLALKIIAVVSFILACISLVLRQTKVLGFSAIILVLCTTVLGEIAPVSVASQSQSIPGISSFGFDWFVLNIFLTGVLFIPLEKLFGRLTDQPLFRTEWREDLFYFLLSSVLVQTLTFLSLLPSMTILQYTQGFNEWRQWIAQQPLIVQVIEIMLLTDFVQYWFHRAFHEVPFLWKFHAVHHSAQKMDWLAGSRMHIVEIVGLRGMTIIPMFVLGFSQSALHVYIWVVYLNATFVHANVRFNVEWLKPILVTPRFHHWHHGIEKEAINVNFAIHFPWLDKLFGTYYMPANQWPRGYGIGGTPLPKGYWGQFMHPFVKKKKVNK